MRGTWSKVLTCALLAGVAATGAAGAVAVPQVAETGRATELPQQVPGGVVVDVGEGDRFKVWRSGDMRTVWGQRYDAATSSWGERRVLVREEKLYCGDIEARAAGTSVAVTALCNLYYYYDDTAPTSSRALWSSDLVTWRAHPLDGEAYQEPGISPDGASAVWPQGGGYLTLTPAQGFVDRTIPAPGLEYTETAVIADDGQVSVLYAGNAGPDSRCQLHVVTQLGDAPPTRQSLDLADACDVDHDLVNVDALTVQLGRRDQPAHLTTVGRPDTVSSWAVTAPAPADVPGLARPRGGVGPVFAHADGLPLVALSSADRRAFEVQAYDAGARRWSAPRQVARMDGPCRRELASSSVRLGVLLVELRCDGREWALISADGRRWTDVAVRRPLGFSADGRWVSTSSRRSTTVFSREEGRVRLPLGAPRRCDVVLPASPRSALRLTTPRVAGWPTVLQRSTSTGWRRTDAVVPPVPARAGACTGVRSQVHDALPTYWFSGPRHGLVLTVVPRGDGWKVRRGVL